MHKSGQAFADGDKSQLSLRRVLFELLVLCGMDRQLGRSGKVDVEGKPDAVAEANYYLYGRGGHPRPARPAKFPILARMWELAVRILITAGLVYYFWWVNANLIHAAVWLLAIPCAVLVGYQFLPNREEYKADLSDDKLFRTWLTLLNEVVTEKAGNETTARTGLLSRMMLYIKPKSSQQIIKQVTDYRVLYTDSWRSFMARGLVRTVAEYLIKAFFVLVWSVSLFHREGWIAGLCIFFMVIVMTNALTNSFIPTRTSPQALRTYLIQHLLAQIQRKDGCASSATAIPALVS